MPPPPQCHIGLATSVDGEAGYHAVWARAVRKYRVIRHAAEAQERNQERARRDEKRNQERARRDAAQKLLLGGTGAAARSSEGETSPCSVVDGMPHWLTSRPTGPPPCNLSFGALCVVASAARRNLDRERNSAAEEDSSWEEQQMEQPPHRRPSGPGSENSSRDRPADTSSFPPVTLSKRKATEEVSSALALKFLSLSQYDLTSFGSSSVLHRPQPHQGPRCQLSPCRSRSAGAQAGREHVH